MCVSFCFLFFIASTDIDVLSIQPFNRTNDYCGDMYNNVFVLYFLCKVLLKEVPM